MEYLPIPERMQILRRLREIHDGRFEDIPPEALSCIGYVAIETAMVPVEIAEARATENTAIVTRTGSTHELSEKYRRGIGFDTISFDAPLTAERTASPIQRGTVNDQFQALVGPLTNETLDWLPAGSPVRMLLADATYGDELSKLAFMFTQHVYSKRVIPLVEQGTLMWSEDYKQCLLLKEDDTTGTLTTDQAIDVSRNLDIATAAMYDEAELARLYEGVIAGTAQQGTIDAKALLAEYARTAGLEDVASALAETGSRNETLAFIARFRKNAQGIKAIDDRLSAIRSEQKAAITDDRRHELQTESAQQQSQKRLLLRTLNGIADFVDMPRLLADRSRKAGNKLQSKLFMKGKVGDALPITIDARYSPDLDANPGKLVNDCTTDRPLPFKDLNVPVYNLKLMSGTDHLGNIYLVEVVVRPGSSMSDPQPDAATYKAWHLEAVQIPNRKLDWKQFPQLLVGALAPYAAESGATAITCNTQSPEISNIDYVGDAMRASALHTEGAYEFAYPKMPPNGRYTRFQGTTDAMVLWKA